MTLLPLYSLHVVVQVMSVFFILLWLLLQHYNKKHFYFIICSPKCYFLFHFFFNCHSIQENIMKCLQENNKRETNVCVQLEDNPDVYILVLLT